MKSSTPKAKNFLALTIVGPLFLWHLLALIIYTSPPNPIREKWVVAIEKYFGPLFSQNWQFFAPDPPVANHYFYYRCLVTGEDNESWHDPGRSLLQAHQKNRFSSNGKLLLLYLEILRGMEIQHHKLSQKLQGEKFYQALQATPQYQISGRFALDLCTQKKGKETVLGVELRTQEIPIAFYQDRYQNKVLPLKHLNYPTFLIEKKTLITRRTP